VDLGNNFKEIQQHFEYTNDVTVAQLGVLFYTSLFREYFTPKGHLPHDY